MNITLERALLFAIITTETKASAGSSSLVSSSSSNTLKQSPLMFVWTFLSYYPHPKRYGTHGTGPLHWMMLSCLSTIGGHDT